MNFNYVTQEWGTIIFYVIKFASNLLSQSIFGCMTMSLLLCPGFINVNSHSAKPYNLDIKLTPFGEVSPLLQSRFATRGVKYLPFMQGFQENYLGLHQGSRFDFSIN